ncbi:MAG: hypothetical protein Q9179_003826, partial [Wetmoreana sp. 5 TL-2023]
SSANARHIVVNGERMQITENLEAALHEWQQSYECRMGLKLWVDSLCINQKSLAERSTEVRRMEMIYATAWRVFAWLGVSYADSDHAMDYIITLSIRSHTLQDLTKFLSPWSPKTDTITRRDLKALSSLLSRPYWQRTWIIQELTLGGVYSQVLCGKRRVSWGQVCEVTRFLNDARMVLQDEHKENLASQSYPGLLRLLQHTCELQDLMQASETPIHHLSDRLCLLHKAQRPPTQLTKSTHFWGCFLKRFLPSLFPTTLDRFKIRSLKIILIGNRHGLPDTWPSWVPDLRLHPDPHHLQIAVDDVYHTSRNSLARVEFLPSERLRCEGFKIAAVPSWTNGASRLSEAPDRHVSQARSDPDTEKAIIRIFGGNHIQQQNATNIGISPTSNNYLSQEQKADVKNDRDHALQSLIIGELNTGWDAISSVSSPESLREAEDVIDRGTMALELLGRAVEASFSRSVVGVVQNQLVWSSHEIQAGDDICVLLGCDYPVILRRHGECYKVVGECYIYGLRNGELMDSMEAGNYFLGSFDLC